jgi:glycosyltransferase involved in cell wall biosynthesis
MKIEMVLPTLEAAGMEVMAARLARALVDKGHDVGITCLENAEALHDNVCRVAVVHAPGFRSNIRAPKLERWFRSVAPDVVHVHSGVWLKAAHAARRAGADRIVHTLHGLLDDEPWFGPALKRCAAHYTDHVAAVSEPLRHYLIREARLEPERVSTIPNGVNTDRHRPRDRAGVLREGLGITHDALVVGTVARLEAVKNHALLLEAFAQVRTRIRDVHLVIVGEGSLRSALAHRARELALGDSVHFVGAAADVAAVYPEFDQFVLASNAEGTSMSVLEAMASGVPVVATAVGGTPTLLDDGRCGVLVPPRNATALAGALTESLLDARRRQTLATAARKRVVEHYSEQAMVRAYEALYQGTPQNMTTEVAHTIARQCVA